MFLGSQGRRLFKGGHLLTFWHFMVGAYSRWAVNLINTVFSHNFLLHLSTHPLSHSGLHFPFCNQWCV